MENGTEMRRTRGKIDNVDPYISMSGSVVLEFRSDGTVGEKGFNVSYRRK